MSIYQLLDSRADGECRPDGAACAGAGHQPVLGAQHHFTIGADIQEKSQLVGFGDPKHEDRDRTLLLSKICSQKQQMLSVRWTSP